MHRFLFFDKLYTKKVAALLGLKFYLFYFTPEIGFPREGLNLRLLSNMCILLSRHPILVYPLIGASKICAFMLFTLALWEIPHNQKNMRR
jgi:hypothetical protein